MTILINTKQFCTKSGHKKLALFIGTCRIVMKNHRSLPNEWNMFKNYQSISRWIFLVDAETRWIIALQSGEKCEETVRKYYLYETKHCLISNRRCPSRKAVQYKFYLAFENSLCKDVSYRICDIVVLLAYLSLFLGLHN